MERSRAGELGWIGIAGGVVAFDLLSPETLSSAFRRGLENERSRYLVLGAWAITTAHLVGLLPEQLDPFKILINHARSE